MSKGFFGGLFDFNKDGKLTGYEKTMDSYSFYKLSSDSMKKKKEKEEQQLRDIHGGLF